jgi:putative tricarboxylic transport membrane protein
MPSTKAFETAVGAGTLGLGAALAVGAVDIPSEAGYGGVGPNFLPWVAAAALMVCGALLVWHARAGGFRERDAPEGAQQGDWLPFAWVTAGILLNAALLTTIGFILSCTLCFVLAVRGFHQSQGRLDLSARAWVRDVLIGFAISAPVYWMFGKLLAINLPGLTRTGWI